MDNVKSLADKSHTQFAAVETQFIPKQNQDSSTYLSGGSRIKLHASWLLLMGHSVRVFERKQITDESTILQGKAL